MIGKFASWNVPSGSNGYKTATPNNRSNILLAEIGKTPSMLFEDLGYILLAVSIYDELPHLNNVMHVNRKKINQGSKEKIYDIFKIYQVYLIVQKVFDGVCEWPSAEKFHKMLFLLTRKCVVADEEDLPLVLLCQMVGA